MFNIKTIFLYGNVEKNVYMYSSERYNGKGKFLNLKKYYTKAPLKWNIRFTDYFRERISSQKVKQVKK